ncbi:MAG: carboxypeptidase-like regulatory domain-containing protein, partial [Candidatus Azobacteroides sp.]|nr:carboxypeptidase-like regulatory domain-containing protein [Candidatus Azobacteroides sp.]
MKHNLKKAGKTLLFLLFLLSAIEITAQTTVTGAVSDESGEPLIGVSVSVKGTSTGVITDVNGAYSINAPGNAILYFNYLGMKPIEMEIKNRKAIDVVMSVDKKELDEVVVIGYGTVKKRDLTGSVASVKAADIDLNASTS